MLLLLIAAAGLAGFVLWVSRPRIAVELQDGRATLVRGELPPGLLSELKDVARSAPHATGHLAIRGTGATLKLTVTGLPEGPAQRVRNVVLLRRDRL
ncbi:MAG: DUF3634 family protein [Deltaproteobacteria bacterium]|nr:DUF3634 family protein [Deltaproteobacteria bacterium]